jgi:pimeloyl-ACP methyl ester carboxylesterase
MKDEMIRRDMTGEWGAWRREVLLPDGTTVGFVDVGEGPVALFVHGIFLSSYLWRHVIDDVIVPSRRWPKCWRPITTSLVL